MKFADISSNSRVCKALASMVDAGRVPHAILLHEDDGGGAMAVAQAFLQYLFCLDHSGQDSCGVCPSCNKISKLIHPDVYYIFPVSGAPTGSFLKEFRRTVVMEPYFTEARLYENLGLENKSAIINVAESKAILETLSLSALEGGYKAVVIYLPERMNKEAGNRLLKSIEEPPAMTQFILVSHAPEQMLQTIVSRCQRIRLTPLPKGSSVTSSVTESFSLLATQMMDALVSRDMLSSLEVGENASALPSRDSMRAFCRYMSEVCRNVFLLQQGMDKMIDRSLPDCSRWASKAKKSFARGAMSALGRASEMIGRNVNQKIVFADLVDRLFLII